MVIICSASFRAQYKRSSSNLEEVKSDFQSGETKGASIYCMWSLSNLDMLEISLIYFARSHAALGAADLGLYAGGSQLTFMTQHEKVIIFRYLLTRKQMRKER